MTRGLLLALGNEFRQDDGIGPVVLEAMRAQYPNLFEYRHHHGDPADLIDLWHNRDTILIDAVVGLTPGSIQIIAGDQEDMFQQTKSTSSHALSISEALALSRIFDMTPKTLCIVGIGGQNFHQGQGLSAVVQAAVYGIIERLLLLAKEATKS